MPEVTKVKDEARTSGGSERRWGRRLGGAALVVLLGLGGAWLGVLLGGTERQSVGPFDTTMALRPCRGFRPGSRRPGSVRLVPAAFEGPAGLRRA